MQLTLACLIPVFLGFLFLLLGLYFRKIRVIVRDREAAIVLNHCNKKLLRIVKGPRITHIFPFREEVQKFPLTYHSVKVPLKNVATRDNLCVEALVSLGFFFHPDKMDISFLRKLLPTLHNIEKIVKDEVEKSIRACVINYSALEIMGNNDIRKQLIRQTRQDFRRRVNEFRLEIVEFDLSFNPTEAMQKANVAAENRRLILELFNGYFATQDLSNQMVVLHALDQILAGKSPVLTNFHLPVHP
jgi:hypothetical protein